MNIRMLVLPLALATTAATGPLLSGCAPLVAAAAVGGTTLVATDRRSAGAQVDDETLELKASSSVTARFGNSVHLNVTSFNGVVLLTGEVPDQKTMDEVVAIVRSSGKMRSMQNELVIAPVSSLGDRSGDTLITSKVKARLVEATHFGARNVKVVTERGVVYLLGILNREEAETASNLVAQTSGVTRVVRLIEYTN